MPSELSTRALRILCLVLLGLGMVGAGIAVLARVKAEQAVRAVDVIVEYGEVTALAGRAGASVSDMLARCREAGATGVAVQEETLTSLAAAGLVSLDAGADLRAEVRGIAPEEAIVGVRAPTPAIFAFALEGLKRAYPEGNVLAVPARQAIIVRGDSELVRDIGLGLLPAKVAHVADAQLRVVPRLHASGWQTPGSVAASVAAMAALLPDPQEGMPRGLVIFDGKSLPGYPDAMGALAQAMARHSLAYGSVEFGKQRGDDPLGRLLKGRLVRVHSISRDELAQMSMAQAVARYALAAKDRNIRAVVLHFPQQTAGDADDLARGELAYIYQTKQSLHESGMTVGPAAVARPFPALVLPAPLLALLCLAAIGAAGYWVLMVLPERLPRGWLVALVGVLVVAVALAAVLALRKPDMGRALFGLVAGLAFPLLGLTAAYRSLHRLADEAAGRAWLPAMAMLVAATATSVFGGLVVAGMMAETRYLVQVEQFVGVKLTLVGPLLVMAALAMSDGIAKTGEGWGSYVARAQGRVRAFLASPVTLGVALLVTVALAGVGLLVLRSGNDAAGSVSGLELKFRALLEQVLIARPRTKEFLIGHPLFILAFLAAARGHRGAAALLLLGGAVGQADVFNTYCHAHTPVHLSLLRTLNGLWIGALFGSLLLWLSARHVKSAKPAAPVTV